MATVVLTVPDGVITRVLDAVALKFNYLEKKLPSETKAQFAKRMLADTVKQWMKDVENIVPHTTEIAAKAAIEQDIETNITIT